MFFGKKQYIEVLCKADGETIIEGHGFKGVSCEQATSFLEKALGSIGKRKNKRERWQKDVQRVIKH